MDVREMEERPAAFIARQVGVPEVAVFGLRRLAGGASREIWSLDVRYEHNGPCCGTTSTPKRGVS